MSFLRTGIGLCALAAGLSAGAIVPSQAAQMLQSGDALAFLFTDASYVRQALSMGMSGYPSEIFFNFVSAPVGFPGQFTAEVESVDGSASALFPGPVGWNSGVVQMSGYSGPASVLSDNLTLSSALSQQIFADSEAELVLTYYGPDITVGLPGYSLRQELTISLAGGPLSIGALDYGGAMVAGANQAATAPEPQSGTLIILAGVLLCAISKALKRFGGSKGSESEEDR